MGWSGRSPPGPQGFYRFTVGHGKEGSLAREGLRRSEEKINHSQSAVSFGIHLGYDHREGENIGTLATWSPHGQDLLRSPPRTTIILV
jgi:hypothetical protein